MSNSGFSTIVGCQRLETMKDEEGETRRRKSRSKAKTMCLINNNIRINSNSNSNSNNSGLYIAAPGYKRGKGERELLMPVAS